jgi:hypothetical protein
VLPWALAATFACQPYDASEDATLVVVVRVEPAVQTATAFPAQVLVGFDSSGEGFVLFRVGFVCDPPSEPFVLTARFQGAAGGVSSVDAWLVPVGSGPPGACGALTVPEHVAASPPRGAGARTSADVAVLASCGEGEVRSGTLVFGG